MVVFSIFGKRPNSFSVCGMEGYICFMVLMALVFGVPLIILSNRVSTLDFRIRSLEGLIANLSPAPQTAEAPERVVDGRVRDGAARDGLIVAVAATQRRGGERSKHRLNASLPLGLRP